MTYIDALRCRWQRLHKALARIYFDTESTCLMTDHPGSKRLTVTVDVSKKVPVVRCSRRLVAGETERFYNDVKNLRSMYKEIVLNFAEVTHLDSSGLGTLARPYVHAKSAGAVLEITNIGKSVQQLLGITHMLSVFQTVGENGIRMG